MGCKLFIRSNPLELTYAGKVFLQYATAINETYTELWKVINDVTNAQVGTLHIGIDYSISNYIMPDLIDTFSREYPETNLAIIETFSDSLHENLMNKRIDVAIGINAKAESNIETKELFRDTLSMVVPNSLLEKNNFCCDLTAAVDLKNFSEYPFILGSTNNISTQIIQKLISKLDFQPKIKAKSDNIQTRIAMCANGTGICFCPTKYIHRMISPELLSKVKIFDIAQDTSYSVGLGYRKDPYQWKMASEFIRIALSRKSEL